MELETLVPQESRLMVWLMVESLQIVIILIAMWVSFKLVKRGLTYLEGFIKGVVPEPAQFQRAQDLIPMFLGDSLRVINREHWNYSQSYRNWVSNWVLS